MNIESNQLRGKLPTNKIDKKKWFEKKSKSKKRLITIRSKKINKGRRENTEIKTKWLVFKTRRLKIDGHMTKYL